MKRQKKIDKSIPVPKPIYDDPDNPRYMQILKKNVPSSETTSPAKSNISLQEQPQMKENVAYSSHQQQSTEAQAEEQC